MLLLLLYSRYYWHAQSIEKFLAEYCMHIIHITYYYYALFNFYMHIHDDDRIRLISIDQDLRQFTRVHIQKAKGHYL